MRTFVISDHEMTAARVREVLVREGYECPVGHVFPVASAVGDLPLTQPELIVAVLSPEPDAALEALEKLRQEVRAPLLVVGPTGEARLVRAAFLLGAIDYIDEVVVESDLPPALFRLRAQTAPESGRGRLIAVLGPSGGSGSSTVAVNVATSLAKQHEKVLLLDLKLHTGDLADLPNLKPVHTLVDLCQKVTHMDRVMLERSLVPHESGVRLLASPRRLSDAAEVTAEGVRQILIRGRDLYPYVVADLEHTFGPEQLQVLRMADVILLVLRLDFTCLRHTRRAIEYLTEMGIARERIQVVVNRYGQPKEVPAAKAEEALGVKVAYYIPDDPKTVNRANNNGIPVVLESPWSKVSRRLASLAAGVNGRA